MTSKHSILTVVGGLSLGVVLSACPGTEKSTEHCYHAQGNETCVERYGNDRPYCVAECHPEVDQNYGCVADEPTDLDCYSPCGGEKNANEDMSCLGVADETDSGTEATDTTDGTDATETETETGPGPCVMDDDCTEPGLPFCDDQGTCVDCSGTADPNAACMGADPAMAVCSEGACVQCSAEESSACMGTMPICDEGTNACVGCSEHEQCPDSACNLELGSCMDVANVRHVDGDSGQMYTVLGIALSENPGPELTIILHEQDNATPYTESVLLNGGTYVAILAAPGEKPVVTGTAGNPSFAVTTGSTLYLYEISASNTPNTGLGLEVNGASAWVQRCRVVNNTGGGILVDGGGDLVLENSFVSGGFSDRVALTMTSGTLEATYVTLGADFGNSAALLCSDGVSKTVRNSLLFSRSDSPEVDCPNVTITTSALEMVMGGNLALGDVDAMTWFADYGNGDFSLLDTAPPDLATAATWQSGDPATDIDGDLRPTTPGTADYAGADIP